MTIRQIGISKDQFYDYVKYEILYENIPEKYNKKMEQLIMCLYKDWGNNLLNALNADFDKKDYEKTDKRKQDKKEYRQTEEYKNYQKDYQKTDKYKEYKKDYYFKKIVKNTMDDLLNQIEINF